MTYTDPRSKTFTRRGVLALVLFNAALLVAAIVFVPTFGSTTLEDGVAGERPTGVQATTAVAVNLPASAALDTIVKQVGENRVLKTWNAGRNGNTALEVSPVEVNCFAKGGPASVVSRTKGWTRGAVNASGLAPESIMWSVRAYAAGQGSAYFEHLRDKAAKCGVALYTRTGLGVEAVVFSSGQVSTLAWRRGDVVSTFGYQRNHRPGFTDVVLGDAAKIDGVMKEVLEEVCTDPGSTFKSDEGRSPYVNPTNYKGLLLTEKFDVDDETMQPPVGWEETGGRQVKHLDLDVLPLDLTPEPEGEPTPVSMPTTVDEPTKPKKPTEPSTQFGARKQTEDVDGPGCGWAFTGQQTVPFDTKVADAQFQVSVDKAQESATNAWTAWFPQVIEYKDAYEAYVDEIKAYNTFVKESVRVSDIWALIQDVRDDYNDAMEDYDKSIQKRQDFLDRKAAAQLRYDEEVQFCETGVFDPAEDRPEPICPATKPPILSKKAPAVGAKPKQPDEDKIVRAYDKAHDDE